MQGVRPAILDGPAGGDERLADDLPAEDPLPTDLGAAAAIEIVLELLQIENRQKVVDGAGHEWRSQQGAAIHPERARGGQA